jgi:hypothetical protein
VPPDAGEVDLLAALLERLASDEPLRDALGAAAREYVRREHDLRRVAKMYVAALEETAGGWFVREALLREVAVAAADVQLDATNPELSQVAAAIRETGLAK